MEPSESGAGDRGCEAMNRDRRQASNDQQPEPTEHHQRRRRRETTGQLKRRPSPTGLTDDRYNENADPKLDDRPPVDR
jgi:hypothetical protein